MGSPVGSVGPGWCPVVVNALCVLGLWRVLAGWRGCWRDAGFSGGCGGAFPGLPIVPQAPAGIKALRPLRGGPAGRP